MNRHVGIAIGVFAAVFGSCGSSAATLGCDAQAQAGYVTGDPHMAAPSGFVEQGFDTSALVVWTRTDQYGNALRKRSRAQRARCGSYEFKFEADWFNHNPQGEMGADDFFTVEIFHNRKRVFGPVALGACESMPGRSRLPCGKAVSWKNDKFVFEPAEGEARRAP